MEYVMSESEREQLARLALLQKVSKLILAKWAWLIVVVFALLATSFSVYLVRHTATSGHRFKAVTSLMYAPRQVARIENMSDKQLMSVLSRRSIKRRVGNEVPMPISEKECLTIDLEIVQGRHPSNIFTLTARAPTRTSAVAKVNAYAAELVKEYVSYRTRDLENWRDSIAVRKQSLQRQIADLEAEESTVKASAGVVAPVETLTMLNSMLSDQRRNQSDLSVQIANEEAKRKRLETAVGKIGPLVAMHAGSIRRKSEEIAQLDAEIARLRELYTDANPKVIGKLEDRERLLASYTTFLEENGISDIDVSDIDRVAESANDLAETTMRIAALQENLVAVNRAIEANEKRAGELTAVIPAYERLRVRRADMDSITRSLEDQIDNIAYLEMSISNDLRQIERTEGADGTNPLRSRNFVIAFAAAGFCSAMLAVWILALELAFGKVSGGREIAAYDDVRYLGALPPPGRMPESTEKDVLGVIALKVSDAEVPNGIVLVSRLPGAEWHPKFWETLDWTLSMAGRPTFTLEIVANAEFTPPEGAETLVSTVYKGQRGWFPVDNRYTLAPTELQILQADLQQLREQYDLIFIHMPSDIRRGGSFYDQLLAVCDIALLGIGVGRTPRNWFSYARTHVEAAKKQAMAVALGESPRKVRREMEAKT